MVISKNTPARRGHVLQSVAGADKHNYYVLQGENGASIAPVTYVAYYSSLNQFEPIHAGDEYPTGFYWVRDAASSGLDHYGDPTVSAGWAMYIWDPTKYQQGVQNSGWVKIAQQGDVDWDINDELKAQFVLKTVYNQRVNTVDERFKIDEAILKNLSKVISSYGPRLEELEKYKHYHHNIDEDGVDQGDNLDVLNRLSDQYKTLCYRGRPIAGNSYVYENNHDGKMWWLDPTDDANFEEEALNSEDIAHRFTATDLAKIGMSLFVIEMTGAISIFKITRKWLNDGTSVLYPVFAQTVVRGNIGVAEYVETLPPASQYYAGRGAWVPTQEDGRHVVGHLHKCVLDTATYSIAKLDPFVIDGVRVKYCVREDNVDLSTLTSADYGSVIYYTDNRALDDIRDRFGVTNVQMDQHPVTGDRLDAGVYKMITVKDLSLASLKNSSATARILYRITNDSLVQRRYVNGGVFTSDAVNKVLCTDDRITEQYVWKDISASSVKTGVIGSTFRACWAESLANLWNDVSLTWKDPDDTVEDGLEVIWAKTYLVRKIGSAPSNINDGTIVKVSTTRDEHAVESFTDTAPYTTQDVYYKLFSETKTGAVYVASSAWKAKPMSWDTLVSYLEAGYASSMFEIGSTVVLPAHSVYGEIECEVIGIDKDANDDPRRGILLASKNVVAVKPFDTAETLQYAKSADTVKLPGKSYYSYNTSTHLYNDVTGSATNPKSQGYYELNKEYGYSCKGSNGWLHWNVSGTEAYHETGTLNIMQWLNSAATSNWWQKKDAMPFDECVDEWASEAGFLAGFGTSARIFSKPTLNGNISTGDAAFTVGNSLVTMALPSKDYFANMTKRKTYGKSTEACPWGTLQGANPTSTPAARRYLGFVKVDGTTSVLGSFAPETEIGIVPIFFIGSDEHI